MPSSDCRPPSGAPPARRPVARRPCTVFALLMSAILLGVSAVAASAGAPQECPSTRAANQLLQCEQCQAVKQLLLDPSVHDIAVEVHDLEHGVIVELESDSKEGITLLHALAREVWLSREPKSKLCDYCQNRLAHLSAAKLDRGSSDHGIILVLSSDDAELVAWLREDARTAQQYVLRAASSR